MSLAMDSERVRFLRELIRANLADSAARYGLPALAIALLGVSSRPWESSKRRRKSACESEAAS
jgi:hypothetical protein